MANLLLQQWEQGYCYGFQDDILGLAAAPPTATYGTVHVRGVPTTISVLDAATKASFTQLYHQHYDRLRNVVKAQLMLMLASVISAIALWIFSSIEVLLGFAAVSLVCTLASLGTVCYGEFVKRRQNLYLGNIAIQIILKAQNAFLHGSDTPFLTPAQEAKVKDNLYMQRDIVTLQQKLFAEQRKTDAAQLARIIAKYYQGQTTDPEVKAFFDMIEKRTGEHISPVTLETADL